MLVLHRRPGQSIFIGESVKVHILGFYAGRIKVKVEAAPGIPIACKNESFLIGKDIKVFIAERTDGWGVKVAIEAPADVRILRAELLCAGKTS